MNNIIGKCPVCGANFDIDPRETTHKCEYCDTQIFIPDLLPKRNVVDSFFDGMERQQEQYKEYLKEYEEKKKELGHDPNRGAIIWCFVLIIFGIALMYFGWRFGG